VDKDLAEELYGETSDWKVFFGVNGRCGRLARGFWFAGSRHRDLSVIVRLVSWMGADVLQLIC
jgi:hypothetical protein